MCKPSTFLLDTKNPLGCSKCFCFGITNRCQPSTLLRTLIADDVEQSNWTTVPPFPITVTNTGVEAAPTAETSQEIFWIAPPAFLGNRVTSYGGKLSYSVVVTSDDTTGSVSPDVILRGRNISAIYFHDAQPSVGLNHEVDVELIERNFESDSGNKITREQFMQLLVGLDEIRIKAGYFPKPKLLTLNYATIETTIPAKLGGVPGNEIALKVEECSCPPEYSGTSCENCAPHHYRSKSGPFLGTVLAVS